MSLTIKHPLEILFTFLCKVQASFRWESEMAWNWKVTNYTNLLLPTKDTYNSIHDSSKCLKMDGKYHCMPKRKSFHSHSQQSCTQKTNSESNMLYSELVLPHPNIQCFSIVCCDVLLFCKLHNIKKWPQVSEYFKVNIINFELVLLILTLSFCCVLDHWFNIQNSYPRKSLVLIDLG